MGRRQAVAGGRWSVVGGQWSVGGRLMPARTNTAKPIAPARYFHVLMPAMVGTTSGVAMTAAAMNPIMKLTPRIFIRALSYAMPNPGQNRIDRTLTITMTMRQISAAPKPAVNIVRRLMPYPAATAELPAEEGSMNPQWLAAMMT